MKAPPTIEGATKNTIMTGRRLSGLDGLRAISILLVVFCHTFDGWSFASYGAFGVAIFFVISGFLITWLLCVEEAKHESISLGTFYIRRALRILPPAYMFLVVAQILGWYKLADVQRSDVLSSALFFRNLVEGGEHTGHFWSLAIEEQFYLLWPIIFLLLRNHIKRLILLTALFVVWPAWYYFRVHYGSANPMSFDIRCVFLLAGCALALARHDRRLARWFSSIYLQGPITPLLAIATICFVSSPWFPIGALVGASDAAAVAVVINYAVEHKGGFLDSRPLVWLGNLSFSLYLWHQVFCWHSKLGWIGRFPQNVIATLL